MTTRAPQLSPREVEVLETYCRCDTIAIAAEELGISPHTVKNHITRILAFLDCATVRQAVYYLWGPGKPIDP